MCWLPSRNSPPPLNDTYQAVQLSVWYLHCYSDGGCLGQLCTGAVAVGSFYWYISVFFPLYRFYFNDCIWFDYKYFAAQTKLILLSS